MGSKPLPATAKHKKHSATKHVVSK